MKRTVTNLIGGSLCSVALACAGTGVANATQVGDSMATSTTVSRSFSTTSDVSDAEVNALADDLEVLFTQYISQGTDGLWRITEAGRASSASIADLNALASMMNGKLPTANPAGGLNMPEGNSYIECILDGIGVGDFLGFFKGAFTALIDKGLWKEAAGYIIKVVGKAAFKGGVPGLAAVIAAYAVWCLTPWS